MLILFFLPMVLFFAVIYFFMIRPEKKKRNRLNEQIANLKKDDEVILNSGIVGVITKINEQTLIVKTSSSSIEVRKEAVMKIEQKEA